MLLLFLLATSCGGKDQKVARAPQAVERAESGWAWTRVDATLRSKPSATSAAVSSIAANERVAYMKVMDLREKATWYWLAPAGAAGGWADARDVSLQRVTAAPAVSAAPRVDATKVTRGTKPILDARALSNVESSSETAQDAAGDLASLQSYVDTIFGGPGAKPDKAQAGRAADAEAFRKGIP